MECTCLHDGAGQKKGKKQRTKNSCRYFEKWKIDSEPRLQEFRKIHDAMLQPFPHPPFIADVSYKKNPTREIAAVLENFESDLRTSSNYFGQEPR